MRIQSWKTETLQNEDGKQWELQNGVSCLRFIAHTQTCRQQSGIGKATPGLSNLKLWTVSYSAVSPSLRPCLLGCDVVFHNALNYLGHHLFIYCFSNQIEEVTARGEHGFSTNNVGPRLRDCSPASSAVIFEANHLWQIKRAHLCSAYWTNYTFEPDDSTLW